MALQTCGLTVTRTQKELQPHGTLAFPCAGFDEWYDEKREIPWHWHEELEIVFVKSGALTLQVPAKRYRLEAGDGLVINANTLHAAQAAPHCALQSLVFHPRLITGDDDAIFAVKYLSPLIVDPAFDAVLLKKPENDGEIGRFLAAFAAYACAPPGFEFAVRAELSQLCLFLARRFPGESVADGTALYQDRKRLKKMLTYLHRHFADRIGLADIARAADIGTRECLRCFQRTIRVSPMQYLLKYRIMQGAALLRANPSQSVSEIALSCGFDSPSNFSKTFKRFYGCAPRAYKKQ